MGAASSRAMVRSAGSSATRNTPTRIRRLVRVARFGARVPETPTYAEALQAIGPAAIKLGQTLATRPDIVGDAAAKDLMRLQDSLPPLPYETIHAAMTRAFGRPPEDLFASIDPVPVGAASIAQVHSAITTDGRHVAVKVLRPGVEEEFARAIDTYQWAAAQIEGLGGELSRLRPRLVIETFKRWTARELDLRREAASASELGRGDGGAARFHRARDRLAAHDQQGPDHRLGRRHQDLEPRGAGRGGI